MEIAFLSPSGYSSLEKKSKLESIAFRPSCKGFFVDVLHDVCQEGALLPMSLILGDGCGLVSLLWPTITAEPVRGPLPFGLLLRSARLCHFPLPVPSLASPANDPTGSCGSPSCPPPFWTSLEAKSSSFTSLEFWLISSKFCLHLEEDECEEEEEWCDCLDNGEADLSEWREWLRGGLPGKFWRLWNLSCE